MTRQYTALEAVGGLFAISGAACIAAGLLYGAARGLSYVEHQHGPVGLVTTTIVAGVALVLAGYSISWWTQRGESA